MLKDVTLGRYYPTSSFLHTLDPRTKLVGVLLYIVSVFLARDPVGLVCTFLFLCFLIAQSKVPLRYMLKGIRSIVFIVVFTDVMNILFVEDGLWKSILITVRMVEIVLGSNLLSLTTKPKEIAAGIEKGLGWMKRIHIPVHDFATMISIAFRFIPILTDEADRIMEAQKARGADFESGNLVRRAKALMPILIPLFVSAFRRADELALAMDSRLYGSGEPTSLHPLSYKREDCVSYVSVLLYFLLILLWRVQPWH